MPRENKISSSYLSSTELADSRSPYSQNIVDTCADIPLSISIVVIRGGAPIQVGGTPRGAGMMLFAVIRERQHATLVSLRPLLA